MHVLKKWREGKMMNLVDSISELISNIDIPEIWKYVQEGSADMTL